GRVPEAPTRLNDRRWSEYASELLEPYAGRIATEALGYWGAVDRYLGLASAVLGNTTSAIAHLENAIEVNRRAEAPTWEARSRVDLARLLVNQHSGDSNRVWTLANAALAVAQQ